MFAKSPIPYEKAMSRIESLRGVVKNAYGLCWRGQWQQVPRTQLDVLERLGLVRRTVCRRTSWPSDLVLPCMVDKVVRVDERTVLQYHYEMTTSAYVAGCQLGYEKHKPKYPIRRKKLYKQTTAVKRKVGRWF